MSKNWTYAAAVVVAGFTATAGNAKAPTSIAVFTQVPTRSAPKRIVYLKNLDSIKTTSLTTRTPVYGPVYNKKGVQVGTKIVSYTSVTVKSTLVTPKTRLYTTNGVSTAFAAPIVDFRFLVSPPVQFAPFVSGDQHAYFALDTTSIAAPVANTGGEYVQSFGTGYASFTRTAPVQILKSNGTPNGPALANLLTVHFQSATLIAKLGTSSMTFLASTPGDPLRFSSDFFNFRNATDYDFSMIFSAPSPGISVAPINPVLTNVTGTRSFNTARTYAIGSFGASSVPEPADWAMLVTGLGMVGVAIRRRKQPLTAAG